MKKVIPALLVVLVAAGAAYFGVTHRTAPGPLKVSGNVEATIVDVSFRIPGRVRERLADEGEEVKTGQVVARLASDDLTEEESARRAEVAAERAMLAELEAGSRKQEIRQAEAALDRVKAEAKRAADDFRRQKSLYEREVVPRSRYDAALAAYESTQAQVREASEGLALVRQGPRQERIAQARARLQGAQKALELAQTRVADSTLVSPLDGTVLSKNVEPGEQVAAGTPVITVGDLDNVWIKAYIPETELGRVKLGQKVTVTTDTWPGRKYDGRVNFISSEAEFTPKSVQTEQERVKLVYRIKISVNNRSRELKPGMPADAVIDTVASK